MTGKVGDLVGKRVLVTGAAKGIGLATAKLLAERGAVVIGFDRSVVDLADVEATRAAGRFLRLICWSTAPGSSSWRAFSTPASRLSTASWRSIRGRRWWWLRR